jgi:hypothetical protein
LSSSPLREVFNLGKRTSKQADHGVVKTAVRNKKWKQAKHRTKTHRVCQYESAPGEDERDGSTALLRTSDALAVLPRAHVIILSLSYH